MVIPNKQLINLPVFTEKGQHLGKISSFGIETSTQSIIKYYVKPENFIKELVEKELIVSAEQVISINKEKMVVEDNIVKETEEEIKKAQLAKNNVAAVPINNAINFVNHLK